MAGLPTRASSLLYGLPSITSGCSLLRTCTIRLPIRRRNRAGLSPASHFNAPNGATTTELCGTNLHYSIFAHHFLGTKVQQRNTLYTISWLCTVSAGIAATLFSGYLPPIVRELTGSADRSVIAYVGSMAGAAFLLGWAIGAVVLGMIGDRIGRKAALLLSVSTCTIGIVATGFIQSVTQLVIVRAATGIGAGSILLLTAVMVSEAWANGNRAKVVGILINAFPVGFILSGVIGSLVNDFRTAYLIGGSSVLLIAAVQFLVNESELWSRSSSITAKTQGTLFSQAHRTDLVIGTTLFGSMLVGLWAVFVWMPTWVGSISLPEQAQHNSARNTIKTNEHKRTYSVRLHVQASARGISIYLQIHLGLWCQR